MHVMIRSAALLMIAMSAPACASSPRAAPDTSASPPARVAVGGAGTSKSPDDPAGQGYTIEELALTVQAAVAIRGQAPATELQAELGTVIPQLVAHVFTARLDLAGPPFVRYHDRSSEVIDFEAGVPVLKPGAGTEEIQAMELPAGPAIATVHAGPYQALPRAHQALAAWATARGREASGPPWEVFLTNPLQEPDLQKWRTKVFLPLKPEN